MPRAERIPTSELINDEANYVYLDVLNLHRLYHEIRGDNLILSGPKGLGKSLSVLAFAAKEKLPIVVFDCSEDARRSHLIGTTVLSGNDSSFALGPLPTAIDVANEHGSCVLLLEEISSLSPQSQKLINPLADFRRSISVFEVGRVYRLNPGSILWVIGTMIDSTLYGGTYSLNEDLKSRFRILPLSYPPVSTERRILREAALGLESKDYDKLLRLADETRKKALDYSLSTRDLVQVGETAKRVGLRIALLLVSGKLEGEDRATYFDRVQAIFGFDLEKSSIADEKIAPYGKPSHEGEMDF